MRQLVQQTLLRLAVVATLVFVPVCLLAPVGFRIVFGATWTDAGVLTMLLGPLWWTSTVVSPVSRLLIVIQKPALKLYFDVLFISGPLAVLYGLRAYGLTIAVAGYGLAAAAAYLVFAVLLWHVSGRADRAALLSVDAAVSSATTSPATISLKAG
jgi:O-antigen/teichoic acid export membrane protein